jgi:hypothetical protein
MIRLRHAIQLPMLWVFALLAIGAEWAFRVPGPAAFVFLPWIGIGLMTTSILAVLVRIGRPAPSDDPLRRVLVLLERVDRMLIVAFVGHGLFLFVNATQSSPLVEVARSEVLARGGGGTDSRLDAWVELRPWQNGRTPQRLLLYPTERRLWGGQAVVVSFRQGLFNQPWIQRIEPDDERRLRAVLGVMPSAAEVWKNLVDYYVRQNRYDEAVTAGTEYLKIYPDDYDFAMRLAGALFNANHHPRAVPLLEPFLPKRPTLEIHQMLGFALFMAGRKADGDGLMRKAIEMQPDEPYSYYMLGYAYFYTGNRTVALQWFERLLQLEPNFPEIQARVREIRSTPTRRPS